MYGGNMVFQKTWLDTRWRFLAGLIILTCSAIGIVLVYPQVVQLLPLAAGIDMHGKLGEEIRKAIELSSSFRGYTWLKWSDGSVLSLGPLFAILLGAGGVFSQSTGGGAYYTLALPVSRRKLLATRAATGLGELLIVLLLPSLAIPLVAPAIGESASLLDAFVHGVCAFTAGSLFFSLTLLLATVFADVWRPVLIAILVAGFIGLGELFLHDDLPFGIFQTMSAEIYHATGALPWIGLAVCAAGSAALIYAAMLNLDRRDF